MSVLDDNIARAEGYLKRFREGGVLNHIGGESVPAASGETFETISPVDLAPLAWGFALAVVAAAFEIGQRLQRETEGLV